MGSTKGAIVDAMQDLRMDGIETNFLQIRYASPFPTSFVDRVLSTAGQKIMVENNYFRPDGWIDTREDGHCNGYKIVKFDGRPFSQNEVYEGVKDILKNRIKEVTVTHA